MDHFRDYRTTTAVFDLLVDGEMRATVEAESRGEARRLFGEQVPETRSVAYQGRVEVRVREHEHAPAAGNISVCVFCQARLDP